MQPWSGKPAINTNTPSEDAFAKLVATTTESLTHINSLALNAAVFNLGEKLAFYRNSLVQPDIQTIADLKAVYAILYYGYGHAFFHDYLQGSFEDILGLVIDPNAISRGKRDTSITPPDVARMIEIYNAVWAIHYKSFMSDPATVLAEWNVNDHYQNRAMRAVLFDIDFDTLNHLCRAMVHSCLEAEANNVPKNLANTIDAKRLLMLSVWVNRDEASKSAVRDIIDADLHQQENILKAVADFLKERPSHSPNTIHMYEMQSLANINYDAIHVQLNKPANKLSNKPKH